MARNLGRAWPLLELALGNRLTKKMRHKSKTRTRLMMSLFVQAPLLFTHKHTCSLLNLNNNTVARSSVPDTGLLLIYILKLLLGLVHSLLPTLTTNRVVLCAGCQRHPAMAP
jgi:hypothetical protein